MRDKEIKEGLADLAHKVEQDHEIQLARGELYKAAKYSIKLHDIMKTMAEEEGLDGWVSAKITKASDYLSTVYHHLDYQTKFDEVSESTCNCNCGKPICESCGKPHKKKKVKEGDGIYHDCAVKFKHGKYGECTVIPEEHTLLEDGTVTHYDATFTGEDGDQYIVRNVAVADMTDVISEGHVHASKSYKKKKMIKKEGGMPTSVIKNKQKYADMSDKELAGHFKGKDEKTLKQMAWRHGYGKMSSHYVDRIKKEAYKETLQTRLKETKSCCNKSEEN
mgnify:FL=1|jgi:hypothetical protein|tara:strand:- start:17197 stop:18027 length:831 start_codon:yes stop_codon:yes gene_type:complete